MGGYEHFWSERWSTQRRLQRQRHVRRAVLHASVNKQLHVRRGQRAVLVPRRSRVDRRRVHLRRARGVRRRATTTARRTACSMQFASTCRDGAGRPRGRRAFAAVLLACWRLGAAPCARRTTARPVGRGRRRRSAARTELVAAAGRRSPTGTAAMSPTCGGKTSPSSRRACAQDVTLFASANGAARPHAPARHERQHGSSACRSAQEAAINFVRDAAGRRSRGGRPVHDQVVRVTQPLTGDLASVEARDPGGVSVREERRCTRRSTSRCAS